ncbi:MAG: RnfABCDGE type electron transport complex subunit B [Burkholderiales bacterium]|jgi:electron transport complex protein RnfB
MPGASPDLIEAIERLLPQTQCTRCGYPDCHAYAVAVANKTAPINQCPPGGQAGIERLARLLDTTVLPLNPEFGVEAPRTTAVIDESRCIGCTLCIQACPVDAIIGGPKRMHTVLTGYCSGCDLCVAPCPVDCIDMIALEELAEEGYEQARQMHDMSSEELAPAFARRYANHNTRTTLKAHKREQRLKKKAPDREAGPRAGTARGAAEKKAATIEAALKRARARHGPDG